MGSREGTGILGKFCEWAQHLQGCGEVGLGLTLGRRLEGRSATKPSCTAQGLCCRLFTAVVKDGPGAFPLMYTLDVPTARGGGSAGLQGPDATEASLSSSVFPACPQPQELPGNLALTMRMLFFWLMEEL